MDAQNTGNRRFSNTFLGYDQNQSVISAVDSSLDQGDFNASLAENLKILYSSIDDFEMTGGSASKTSRLF